MKDSLGISQLAKHSLNGVDCWNNATKLLHYFDNLRLRLMIQFDTYLKQSHLWYCFEMKVS